MFDRDLLCRSAHWPKFLDRNAGGTGVWSVETFLDFQPSDASKALYRTSVASRHILKTTDAAHEYGIRAAKLKNQRVTSTTGHWPEPLSSNSVHYLGFYDFEYGALAKLPLTHHVAEAFWKPEEGEDSHFQLQLRRLAPGGKSELRKDRRAGIGAIGLALMGPYRRTAPEDAEFADELEAIDLPVLPV